MSVQEIIERLEKENEQLKAKLKRAPLGTCQSDCSDLNIEVWECHACGAEAPCRVEITHRQAKRQVVDRDREPRFTERNRGCLCDNNQVANWKKLPNASGELPTGANFTRKD